MIHAMVVCAAWFWSMSPLGPADVSWPNWRGPNRDGSSLVDNLPLNWSNDANIRWRVELPAWAGSSPVLWRDRVFLTSPSARGDDEPEGEIGRNFRRRAVSIEGPGGARILLMCIAASNGKLLWQQELDRRNKLFGKHNMASPSPVTDGSRVWALTGTGVLSCFEMAGRPVWSFDLQEKYGEFGLYWGYASSPLLFEDRIFVQVLHGATTKNPSYVVAFDKGSGKVLWRQDRKTGARQECTDAYTTPTIVRADGRNELIVSGADFITAHDPATGNELWRCGGLNPEGAGNYRICGSPVAAGGLVIATSREKPVLAVKPGGQSDVTDSRVAWRYTGRKGPDVPSAALSGERLYMLHDDGFITCLEARSGSVLWGPERIEGGPYSASPLVAAGRVYCTNENGVTTVLADGPQFKSLAINRLDGGYTLSSLAVGDRCLLLRTAKYLYCIGEPRSR